MAVYKASSSESTNRHCPKICLAILILIIFLAIVLGLTVFKVKHPVITVHSTSISTFKVSLTPSLSLNISISISLSVKNPNSVSFKYRDSSAFMYYKGLLVGEVPIPAGEIYAESTKEFHLTVTVLADRLLSDPTLYSDIVLGSLGFTAVTKVHGKVEIFGLVTVHVTSESSCDVIVDVLSASIKQQTCKYKTKL